MGKVTRPALRYHGGKWLLAPWIIGHFPEHRIYVEPFGGAASVLLRKRRSYAEVYNDLDSEVVGFFRVLQDGASAQLLLEKLRMTPFARAEFELAYSATECSVERARRLVIRSFMGFGSDGHNDARPTGFRANSSRSGTTPAHDWVSYAEALPALIERLRGIVIENRDAREVMAQHDALETLHYVDPPYLPATRAKARNGECKEYRFELDESDHEQLLGFLTKLKGMVLLSGYPSELYDAALPGWQRVDRKALADGARERVECLWLNPAAAKMAPQKALFEDAA